MAKKLQRKVQVQVQRTAVGPSGGGGGDGSPGAMARRLGRGRVTPRSLAEFTNQLAVLLNAGIPIVKGLRILEGQLPPGGMKRMRSPRFAPIPDSVHEPVRKALAAQGVERLYEHQAEAWDAAARGEHLVVTTGTASFRWSAPAYRGGYRQ